MIHITRDLLRAVQRGTVPPRVLVNFGLDHLMHLCPHCAGEIDAWRREEATSRSYHSTFAALPAVLKHHTEELHGKHGQAARDLEELLALPHEARVQKMARARSRFRGPVFASLLIDESKKRIFTDPEEAYRLAQLARTSVHYSPAMPGAYDFIARATAHMGNARKAAARLQEADGEFAHVRLVVTKFGVTDTEVLGELALLEGALRKEQRRFAEAEELLSQAVLLYGSIEHVEGAARALLVLAASYYHAGEAHKAADTVRLALARISPEENLRLYVGARQNLALYIAEEGAYREALDILTADRDLYETFEAGIQLRRTWLAGKIATGMGERKEAEHTLRATREGFVALGRGYEAAQVSLDLARLYAGEGRMPEVRELVEEMVPIFEAQDIHHEAAAARSLQFMGRAEA